MSKRFVVLALLVAASSAYAVESLSATEMAAKYSALQQRNELLKLEVENQKYERELAAPIAPSNPSLESMKAAQSSESSTIHLVQTDGIAFKRRAKFFVNGIELYVFEGDEIVPGTMLLEVRTASVVIKKSGRKSVLTMSAGPSVAVQAVPAATTTGQDFNGTLIQH